MTDAYDVASDLRGRFEHHPPSSDQIVRAHEAVRAACLAAAQVVSGNVPAGREKALAFTHLEDAMMWANAGIARNQERVG